MAAGGELGVDRQLRGRDPQLLEATDLGARERLVGDIRERLAAEQRERRPAALPGSPASAARAASETSRSRRPVYARR